MNIKKFILSTMVLALFMQTITILGMKQRNNENNNGTTAEVKENWFSKDHNFDFFKKSVHNVAFFKWGHAKEIFPSVNANRYNDKWQCVDSEIYINLLGKFAFLDENFKEIPREHFFNGETSFLLNDDKFLLVKIDGGIYQSKNEIPQDNINRSKVLPKQNEIKFIRLSKSFWSNFK